MPRNDKTNWHNALKQPSEAELYKRSSCCKRIGNQFSFICSTSTWLSWSYNDMLTIYIMFWDVASAGKMHFQRWAWMTVVLYELYTTAQRICTQNCLFCLSTRHNFVDVQAFGLLVFKMFFLGHPALIVSILCPR